MDKSKCELGFVILNYNTAKETMDCVSSIKAKVDTDSYIIIIVDNASVDDSYEMLSSRYGSDTRVRLIRNSENLGFASGNNQGIRAAKYDYNCSFVCVLNSDTLLVQDDFFSALLQDFEEHKYAVLGPDIATPDKIPCNPMGTYMITYEESKRKVLSLKIQIFLNYLCLDKAVRSLMSFRKKKTAMLDPGEHHVNVKLHGCCLVFSPIFLEHYDGFDEGTFLYLEEDLLYLHMMKDCRITLYSPRVKIYHLEDASTNKLAKGRKKNRFVLKQHLKSMQVIQEYAKEWRFYEQ